MKKTRYEIIDYLSNYLSRIFHIRLWWLDSDMIGIQLAWKWMKSFILLQKRQETLQSFISLISHKYQTSTKCTNCTIHAQVRKYMTWERYFNICSVMFFFRNKHIMIDLGTGNNNKINWAIEDKQEFIDIVETVYRGARKGRGLVVSPKDYSTKYRYWTHFPTGTACLNSLSDLVLFRNHYRDVVTNNLILFRTQKTWGNHTRILCVKSSSIRLRSII